MLEGPYFERCLRVQANPREISAVSWWELPFFC